VTHAAILNKNEHPLDVSEWKKWPGVAPYSIYIQQMPQTKINIERIKTKQDKQDDDLINPRQFRKYFCASPRCSSISGVLNLHQHTYKGQAL